MVAALQQMSENLQHLNRSVAPGPSSHTLVQQGPAEYRGLDKSCKRNPSRFQGGFTPNAAIEWVQGMECTNMKADGVATSESIPHKDFGPQRNFVHGRGKDKRYREERKHYFPRVGTRSCISTTNHRFRCKETGPIKRHCPTSRQGMNAMGTGRPQSIGRVVTMYGAEASESDSLIRCGMYEERGMDVSTARSLSIIKGVVPSWIGDLMPLLPRRQETTVRCADKVVAVRDLCEIADQASGLVPVSAKRVRTLLRKRDREILRLEAVSVELEKLPRTKPNTHRGFSLEREVLRLSESWLAWVRERVLTLNDPRLSENPSLEREFQI
ncbi:hypothetical protein Lal_00049490 [Lupinus albus]|nr:hypothetical protein Lal_00049490 [Lupinus albus]